MHGMLGMGGFIHEIILFVDMIFARRAMMMMFATKCMGSSNEVR
jgi:hypothetical protein